MAALVAGFLDGSFRGYLGSTKGTLVGFETLPLIGFFFYGGMINKQ